MYCCLYIKVYMYGCICRYLQVYVWSLSFIFFCFFPSINFQKNKNVFWIYVCFCLCLYLDIHMSVFVGIFKCRYHLSLPYSSASFHLWNSRNTRFVCLLFLCLLNWEHLLYKAHRQGHVIPREYNESDWSIGQFLFLFWLYFF